MLSLLLAAALCAGVLGSSALAAQPGEQDAQSQTETQADASQNSQPETQDNSAGGQAGQNQEQTDQEQTDQEQTDQEQAGQEIQIEPDPAGTLSFENLAARIRANNLTVLSLEESIASVEATDYDKLTDNVRKQLNQIANQQWNLQFSASAFPDGVLNIGDKIAISTASSIAGSSLQSAYDSLRDTFDDLKDGEIQKDNADLVLQLRNAQDQIVMAGEGLYVALAELEGNQKTVERGLATIDRSVEEMELRYQLGQISALTLQQVKAQRTQLVSTQQTLEMNLSTYKMQLELLAGADITGKAALGALPGVTNEELSAMDVEADLARAKENSYELYAALVTLEDAREDWKDAEKKYSLNPSRYEYIQAQHVWQGAQYTYNAAVQDFEVRFRTLCQQVRDYAQVLDAARTALACEQDEYAAQQLKYEQGNLSQNKLADAGDDLAAAQDTVDTAQRNLFSAYNNYRWAVDRGILN